MHSTITEKLCQVEADYDVRILWAIESGSRSWGFDLTGETPENTAS
jgi:uncharacterized protein